MQYRQGYIALITVLIISAVALAIAATVSLLGIGVTQSALAGSKGENALQLAEGCAEDALLKSQKSSSYSGGNITRPEGTCIISVSKNGNNWTITSTSTQTDFNRTVQINFVRTSGSPIDISSWQEVPPMPTPTPTAPPPPTFMESGTDATQDTSFYASTFIPTGASITSDSTIARTGPRSIKFISGNPASSVIVQTPAGSAPGNKGRVSFDFYLNNYITGNFAQLFNGNTYVTQIFGVDPATHKVVGTTSSDGEGTTTVNLNTWYHVSIGYNITSTTVNQFQVYLNGHLELTNTNDTFSTINPDQFRFGVLSPTGVSEVLHLDDIYVDSGTDLSDPGDIHVTAKRPFANGFANSWATRIGAGSSGYGSGHALEVNERPLSSTNGWKATANLTQEYYTIESAATGDEDISGNTLVADQAWIYLTGTSCSGSLPEIMNNNVLTGFTMPTSPTMITNYAILSSYPSSNEAVGVLGCGVNASPSYSLYEAGLQVAYK